MAEKKPQKFYPLKGEAENAVYLNQYLEHRKKFEASLPKPRPRKPAPTGPSSTNLLRSGTLLAKANLKPTIDSTIGKLNSSSSRADSVRAYSNVAKGVAKAESARIQANKMLNAAYDNMEKGRTARTDATATARNLAIPLGDSNWTTPEEAESLAKRLKSKR